MARQTPCGPAEAARKVRLSRAYLDLAEQAATHDSDETRTVAAGNAVLAAIAASDALTCLHLGRHSRGQGHQEATALLRTITPDGAQSVISQSVPGARSSGTTAEIPASSAGDAVGRDRPNGPSVSAATL